MLGERILLHQSGGLPASRQRTEREGHTGKFAPPPNLFQSWRLEMEWAGTFSWLTRGCMRAGAPFDKMGGRFEDTRVVRWVFGQREKVPLIQTGGNWLLFGLV